MVGTVNDLLITFGPYDMSGESNSFDMKNPIELAQINLANPVGTIGQLPVPTRVAVGEDFSLTGAGYLRTDGVAVNALMLGSVVRNDALIGVSDVRGVGQQVVFTRGARGEYARQAQVGDTLKYTFSAMSNDAIWWGLQGEYADISASADGTGFQFGAVTADQQLILALVAERLSGTGSLDIAWETATAGTFVGSTERDTFTTVTALGEEVLFIDGAITDTWGRPVFTKTGSGTWRVRIYVAIA